MMANIVVTIVTICQYRGGEGLFIEGMILNLVIESGLCLGETFRDFMFFFLITKVSIGEFNCFHLLGIAFFNMFEGIESKFKFAFYI